MITIHVRVGSYREIPVGSGLREMLSRHRQSSTSNLVFATTTGRPLSTQRAKIHFRRVRKLIGIRRVDNATYEPGFNDLRHTFAVERITDWYRKAADVDLMLPRPAHYMGLFTCIVTERYLPLVSEHFRAQLNQLSEK